MRHTFVIGTRPEVIKCASTLRALGPHAVVLATGQHDELFAQTALDLGIHVDRNLGLRVERLEDFIGAALPAVCDALRTPSVVVQGDTASCLVGALAAALKGAHLSHIEAGLRSGTKRSPWPEELFRRAVTHMADLHFAPTESAAENLVHEGVRRRRIVTAGSTSVDLLADHPRRTPERLVLVTAHRRESRGARIRQMAVAVERLAREHPDHDFVVLRHPAVEDVFHGVRCVPPAPHSAFLDLLARARLVLSDSGGIQEEALALHVPLLIMRDVTEWGDGVAAGGARIIGTTARGIFAAADKLLSDQDALDAMSAARNPYGDGHAGERIAEKLRALTIRDACL